MYFLGIETLNTSYALDSNSLKITDTALTIVESRSESSLDVVLDALDGIIQHTFYQYK